MLHFLVRSLRKDVRTVTVFIVRSKPKSAEYRQRRRLQAVRGKLGSIIHHRENAPQHLFQQPRVLYDMAEENHSGHLQAPRVVRWTLVKQSVPCWRDWPDDGPKRGVYRLNHINWPGLRRPQMRRSCDQAVLRKPQGRTISQWMETLSVYHCFL